MIYLGIFLLIGFIFFFIILRHNKHSEDIKILNKGLESLKNFEAVVEHKPVNLGQVKASPGNPPPKTAIGLDSTKLKSRQPSNHNVVPAGFKEQITNIDGNTIAHLERIYPQAFTYKFFGSSLVLPNGSVILTGLISKLHILEVSEDNQLRVDNQEFKLHPDVIERLRVIANTREE